MHLCKAFLGGPDSTVWTGQKVKLDQNGTNHPPKGARGGGSASKWTERGICDLRRGRYRRWSMSLHVTRHRAARLGGGLFVAAGLLTLANNFQPGTRAEDVPLQATVAVIAILAGLISWFLIPWERLPARASLSLPLLGLALLGITAAQVAMPGHEFSAFFILIAAYIGATQPRWTTLLFSPALLIVYLWALQQRPATTTREMWSVTVVIPVCILIGEMLSTILTNAARAQASSTRRAELLAITARAARSVSALEARQVLRAVADAATELGYEAVALEIFDREQSTYRCMEGRGLPEDFTNKTHPSDSGITGEVRRVRGQVVVENYTRDPRALQSLQGLGFQLVIGTPIWTGTHMIAVLNVGTRSGVKVEDAELEALVLLADQAGHALELAEVHENERRERERYRREALVDELTGLGNRRHADQLIDTARAGDAIAMLDLDNFKQLNDEQGHAAGDLVLAGLGGFFRTKLRGGDTAARFGGEEFVLVFRRPGLDLPEAIERMRFGWLDTNPMTTFSVGTAIVRIGESPRAALARADAALLDAKAAGKNCARHADLGMSAEERADEATTRRKGA